MVHSSPCNAYRAILSRAVGAMRAGYLTIVAVDKGAADLRSLTRALLFDSLAAELERLERP